MAQIRTESTQSTTNGFFGETVNKLQDGKNYKIINKKDHKKRTKKKTP